MPKVVGQHGPAPWYRRLYLPAYQIKDAARYAKTAPQRVAYWHYRGGGLGPVLPYRVRRRPLSYLELVEVAFVATMRQIGLPLQRIRGARQYIAQTFTSEYPFAEHRFKTEGTHLLMKLSEIEVDFEARRVLVADRAGQVAWESMMARRFYEFDYESVALDGQKADLALRWHVAGYHNRPNELAAIRHHGMGCFYLWGAEATNWEVLTCLAKGYERMMDAATITPRPFIHRVSKNGRLQAVSI